jgi:hypothetical protein
VFANALLSVEESIQKRPLVIQEGLWRIHVFGTLFVQGAAAETKDLAGRIQDRKHEAIPESVIVTLTRFPLHHETQFARHGDGIAISLQAANQAFPLLGGIAEQIERRHGWLDPAFPQISARRFSLPAFLKSLLEELTGTAIQGNSNLIGLVLLGTQLGSLGFDLYTCSTCEFFQGLRKRNMVKLHEESVSIPSGSASKAVECVPIRIHDE